MLIKQILSSVELFVYPFVILFFWKKKNQKEKKKEDIDRGLDDHGNILLKDETIETSAVHAGIRTVVTEELHWRFFALNQ